MQKCIANRYATPGKLFPVVHVVKSKFPSYVGMPQIAHQKMKKLPTMGGGTHPPPARSLRSLGLGRFAPSQRLCPPPPRCFGSLRHCT